MAVSIKINQREFDKTLRDYLTLTNKEPAIICNTKAFYIARAASRFTYRPPKDKIKAELEAVAKEVKTSKSGKTRKVWAKNAAGAPIAALLINWRRGKLGKPGLFGAAMKDAVKNFIKKRQQARAYMASGWNPAIKGFEPLAEKIKGAAPRDREAMTHRGKGSFNPARTMVKAIARLANMSFSKLSTTKDPDLKIAQPALQKAFDSEVASMREHFERRYKAAAQRLGIRTR